MTLILYLTGASLVFAAVILGYRIGSGSWPWK